MIETLYTVLVETAIRLGLIAMLLFVPEALEWVGRWRFLPVRWSSWDAAPWPRDLTVGLDTSSCPCCGKQAEGPWCPGCEVAL